MKILLRSCFRAKPSEDEDLFLRNYLALMDSGLGFDTQEDNVIWSFIQDFVRTHNHVPGLDTLRAHFKRAGEVEVGDRLEGVLVPLVPKTKGDFLKRLEDKANDRRRLRWAEVLKEASAITTSGLVVKEGKQERILKGPIDSARYVMQQSHSIVAPTIGARLSGEVTKDGQDFKKEYEILESDPLAGIGQMTGIQQIDITLYGAKRFELWTHAAFTGSMKSTFLLNWMYNQSVYFKHNSLYFSLEMPYNQCRRILFAIHSHHEKFKKIRFSLGLQQDPNVSLGLEYDKIKTGSLSPQEKEFLFDHVIRDLDDPSNEYGEIHIEIADPHEDKVDFTIVDLRSKAEILFSKTPFSLIGIDHAGLMSARKRYSSTSEALNEVFRDLKRLALTFDRGRGMAVVALHQINREGYKAALKRKEKTGIPGYNLTDLAFASECERSSDIVTASWVDEEFKQMNRVLFQSLKNRDGALFLPFIARVEWPCRRILTCHDPLPDFGGEASIQKSFREDPEVEQLGELLESL